MLIYSFTSGGRLIRKVLGRNCRSLYILLLYATAWGLSYRVKDSRYIRWTAQRPKSPIETFRPLGINSYRLLLSRFWKRSTLVLRSDLKLHPCQDHLEPLTLLILWSLLIFPLGCNRYFLQFSVAFFFGFTNIYFRYL